MSVSSNNEQGKCLARCWENAVQSMFSSENNEVSRVYGACVWVSFVFVCL